MSLNAAQKRRVYLDKPCLRRIYNDWFNLIKSYLVRGETLEIGSGFGQVKDYINCVTSDLKNNEFIDKIIDARHLPYPDGSLSNIIGVDILHHINNPKQFANEAARAIKSGGRIILIEPYISPVSNVARKLFHYEPIDFKILEIKQGEESNMAIPTLLFFRSVKYREIFSDFKLVKLEKFGYLLYPLSGGFTQYSFLSNKLYSIVSF